MHEVVVHAVEQSCCTLPSNPPAEIDLIIVKTDQLVATRTSVWLHSEYPALIVYVVGWRCNSMYDMLSSDQQLQP